MMIEKFRKLCDNAMMLSMARCTLNGSIIYRQQDIYRKSIPKLTKSWGFTVSDKQRVNSENRDCSSYDPCMTNESFNLLVIDTNS